MFEGVEGIPILVVLSIAIATVLATFGVKIIELLMVRLRQKKYNGENDRRKPCAANNPGNSTSAVEQGKMGVHLEHMAEKLGVFHRDFFDKNNEQTEALRDISTAVRELDKNTQEGHDRLRVSVTELQVKIDTNSLEVQTMSGKLSRFIKAK